MCTRKGALKNIHAVRNSKLYLLQALDKTRKYYKEAISVLLMPKPSPLKVMLLG